MSELKAIVEGNAAQTTAETLRVERRVLVTPHTSIRIDSIATLSVVPVVQKKPSVLIPIVATILAAAIAYAIMDPTLSPYAYSAGPNERNLLLVGAGMIVASLLLYHFAYAREQWRLLVGTSDGGLNYFTAPRRETLVKVRDLLTERIN